MNYQNAVDLPVGKKIISHDLEVLKAIGYDKSTVEKMEQTFEGWLELELKATFTVKDKIIEPKMVYFLVEENSLKIPHKSSDYINAIQTPTGNIIINP